MKYFFLLLFILISLIIFSSCNNSTQPVPAQYEISARSEAIEIAADPAGLIITDSPVFTFDYSALAIKGANIFASKYYPPDTADMEFNISANDSFSIEIKNCSNKYIWRLDDGTIDVTSFRYWLNSEIALVRTENTIVNDSIVNYRYTFRTLKGGKGYLCFIETDLTGGASSNESHGLVVGYNINPLDKIFLNLDEVQWKYNIEKGSSSTVRVRVKGSTNVYRLRGMTHGDGATAAIEIPLKDSRFEYEIPVAFSHMEGITLKASSQLLLYGSPGLPVTVELKNPKSDK